MFWLRLLCVVVFDIYHVIAGTVGVVVVTASGPIYKRRVRAARRTWARNQSVVFLAGTAVISEDPDIETVSCNDGRAGVCCKTLAALRLGLARFPEALWLVRAVDDTYVYIDQLEKELLAFNPNSFAYIGSASVLATCHLLGLEGGQAGACGEAHAGGGGGVVLSRPLVVELLKHADLFLETCQRDDLHLGHFLRYVLDVHVLSLPGILQSPRVAEIAWAAPRVVCSTPLPPAVYSRVDDAGPLHPFAPLDVSRLAMLHSDPAVWRALGNIPVVSADLQRRAAGGASVLAYIDLGGRQVVGPAFEGADTLSICAHSPRTRAETYAAATARVRSDIVPSSGITLRWAEELGHSAAVKELCDEACDVQESFREYSVAVVDRNGTASFGQERILSELQIDVRISRRL